MSRKGNQCPQHRELLPLQETSPADSVKMYQPLHPQADSTRHRRADQELKADLAALKRMHDLSMKLTEADGLRPLLQEIMDAAVAIVGAQRGTLQLIEGDSLRIVAHHGHKQPFIRFFASAETQASVCGEALKQGQRVIVEDVESSSLFAFTASLKALREAGVRAIQSTPLRTRRGELLGILTTQWSTPHVPDEHDLWRIDLLARQAADLIEHRQAEETLHCANENLQARAEQLETLNDMLQTRQKELETANEDLREQEKDLMDYAEALRTSQQRLALAVSETRIGIYEWNVVTGESLWTEQVAELLGLGAAASSRPHPYRDWADRIHPEDRARVEARVRRCMAERTPHESEYRIVWPDGSVHWVVSRGVFQYDSNGCCTRLLGIIMDITERKRAEQASRIKDSAIASSLNAIAMADERGCLTYVNPAFLALWGYMDEGDVLGKSVLDFWKEPSQAAEVIRAIQNGQGWTGELVAVRKDGACLNLYLSASAVLNDAGAPICMMASFIDITERKQTEEALRESEARYRTLFESIDEGFCTIEMRFDDAGRPVDYRFLEVNPSFERQTGIENAPGRWMREIAPNHEEHWFEIHGRVAQTGEPVRFENPAKALGHFYDVYAFRVGPPEQRRVAILFNDISERKKAEESLRESEERFRKVFENASIGILIADADRHYHAVNDRFCEMMGRSRDELLTSGCGNLLHPDDQAGDIENVGRLLRGEVSSFTRDMRYIRSDGAIVWVRVNVSRLPGREEDSPRLVAIMEDITERKRAEEALRESEALMHAVMDGSPDLIYMKDLDARILLVNPAACEALGRPAKDVIGHNAREFHRDDPDVGRAILENDRRIMESGQTETVEELGSKGRTYLSTKAPYRDAAGNIIGLLGISHDITERKQAEEALRESEEKFRLLAETSPAAILIYQDGTLVYLNPTIESITGYTCRELLGKELSCILHPDYRQEVEKLASQRAQGEGLPASYELRILTKDGQERWMNVSSVSILYASRPAGLVVAFDITERKRAEQALRESERRYRKLFEANLAGVYLSKLDGTILDCNDAMIRMVGNDSREEVLGRRSSDFYANPELRQGLAHLLQRDGAIPAREAVLRQEDGTLLHVFGSAVLLANEQTGEPYVQGMLIDITQRVQAEEALRASEERLALAVSGTQIGIYEWNVVTGESLWTEQVAKLLGLDVTASSRPHPYRDWADRIHPEDRARVEARVRRCMAERTPHESEYRIIWPDGSVHWVVSRGVFQYDSNGCCTRLLGIIMDITERKQAEEALRESEERFRRYFELGLIGMAITSPAKGWIEVNDECCRLLGYERDELTRKTWAELTYPDDLAADVAQFDRVLAGQIDGYTIDKRFVRKDGQVVDTIISVAAMRGADGRVDHFVVLLQDITARKRAEEALRELNVTLESRVAQRTAELVHRARQLQKLTLELTQAEDRERKRLAEILHEDLQQQLAGARFHLNFLTNHACPESPETVAHRVGEMLKEAIEKSRNLSHELSPAVLQHNDMAEALRWLARQVQVKHGMVVNVKAPEQMTLQLEALTTFLFRAAQELLFNVIKHARVHEAKARVRRLGRYVCLSVSDQGRGFDLGALERTAGFGLLSIRERVELLGGRMRISSAEGKGSVVHIVVRDGELSNKDVGIERAATSQIRNTAEARGQPRLRMLIVDDHAVVRQGLVGLLLGSGGVEVVGEAANGREAVNLTCQLRPDVVLMDVVMPLMNGDEATRQIKTQLPGTRVIALSLHDEADVVESMRQAGAEGFVLKTASAEELLAAIRGQAGNLP